MPRCLIGLGSNLGDRSATLDAAVDRLARLPSARVLAQSRWMRSDAVGGKAPQREFLNGAALVDTDLPPAGLLAQLQAIEADHGRERRERWAARTLDIDLLLYGDHFSDEASVEIPHPRMTFRPFVLAPSVEIAAEMRHPLLSRTIRGLLDQLQRGSDQIALIGGNEREKGALMNQLSERFPGLSAMANLGSRRERTQSGTIDIRTTEGRDPGPRIAGPKLSLVFGPPCQAAGQGPTLWLSPKGDPERHAEEAVAAIECLWPGLA